MLKTDLSCILSVAVGMYLYTFDSHLLIVEGALAGG